MKNKFREVDGQLLGKYQAGLINSRLTIDQLKRVMANTYEHNLSLHIISGYDSINKIKLYEILRD